MFGIDSSELAVIALVALLVIGPKDLPRVMRMVGQWMAKGRAMTRHVRAGFDTMMREAELDEMQKQWAAQNEAIMKATALPDLKLPDPGVKEVLPDLSADEWMRPGPAVSADMRGLHAASEADPAAAETPDGDATAVADPVADKPRRRRKADTTAPVAADTAVAAPPKPTKKRSARARPEPQTTES